MSPKTLVIRGHGITSRERCAKQPSKNKQNDSSVNGGLVKTAEQKSLADILLCSKIANT